MVADEPDCARGPGCYQFGCCCSTLSLLKVARLGDERQAIHGGFGPADVTTINRWVLRTTFLIIFFLFFSPNLLFPFSFGCFLQTFGKMKQKVGQPPIDSRDQMLQKPLSVSDEIPMIVIVSVSVLGTLLFLLNVVLISCFIHKKRKRDKQQEQQQQQTKGNGSSDGRRPKNALKRLTGGGGLTSSYPETLIFSWNRHKKYF